MHACEICEDLARILQTLMGGHSIPLSGLFSIVTVVMLRRAMRSLMIGSRSLCTTIPQRAGAPVFKVTDGAIFIAGGGDALDTICYMADDTTEEYLRDVCDICKTYLPGQPILSFSPSRESYAYGYYSDVQINACESCIQSMFKAVKEANYKRE